MLRMILRPVELLSLRLQLRKQQAWQAEYDKLCERQFIRQGMRDEQQRIERQRRRENGGSS